MNLMEAILGGNASPVSKLAGKFGMSEGDAADVVKQLIPALTNGMKKNVEKKSGLDGLLAAVNGGGHDRYLDDPRALDSEDAALDGNAILGHLLKNKDVSRKLARKAAENTGQDYGAIKKMLPLVAGLVMGAMKKQGGSSGLLSALGRGESSGMGSLLGLLDADGDGSPVDDLLGFAKKLF